MTAMGKDTITMHNNIEAPAMVLFHFTLVDFIECETVNTVVVGDGDAQSGHALSPFPFPVFPILPPAAMATTNPFRAAPSRLLACPVPALAWLPAT